MWMNKKGDSLVNLRQLENDPPPTHYPKQHSNLKFLDCENDI